MSDGTALPRFKRAFIQTLEAAGIPNVSYESPMQPEDLLGDDGSGLAGWFADTAQGSLDIQLLGSTALWVDEKWSVPFVIQALGRDTDADQETVDQSACELLGSVLACFSDPHFGLTDDTTIQVFAAVPVGATPWYGGILPTNLRACRYELMIELSARINIP